MTFLKPDLFFNTIFGTILCFLVVQQSISTYVSIKGHTNELCYGLCAEKRMLPEDHKSVKIPANPLPDLDYKSKDEILSNRTALVEQYAFLLKGTYKPAPQIFDQIASGLRWWGVDGYYQNLRSSDLPTWSVTGKSLRGEEIYNPFYLITFKPLTYTVENPEFKWNESALPGLTGSKCPYVPRKSDVLWKPFQGRAEVVYFVQEFMELLSSNNCLETNLPMKQISVGLDPVNAQDMGFQFLSFSKEDSKNIDLTSLEKDIIPLEFYYHRGTSCRIPEGCNNISPLVKDLFGKIKIQALPARIVTNVWKEYPSERKSGSSFRYVIHIR
jgi:hypothetical protein